MAKTAPWRRGGGRLGNATCMGKQQPFVHPVGASQPYEQHTVTTWSMWQHMWRAVDDLRLLTPLASINSAPIA